MAVMMFKCLNNPVPDYLVSLELLKDLYLMELLNLKTISSLKSWIQQQDNEILPIIELRSGTALMKTKKSNPCHNLLNSYFRTEHGLQGAL